MDITIPETIDAWNAAGAAYLPGRLGMRFSKVEADEVVCELDVSTALKAWNGFLHAGTVVALADTACGYGALKCLPPEASGFTTLELKSNHLGTAQEGVIRCVARPIHVGRTTQVWDAEVTSEQSGKVIAHFRCTQMVLWPRG
jgi:uncharacterized protein (TIGR00369 family)